ncbi:MAG: DNA alkylation repair protein [Lachnospiraceae bacterium]|nr:DNA alkylation repair protein [Lachnospiraceae bacterium]
MTIEEINQRLFTLAEEKNAKRSSSIIPGAKPILGARIPDLRRLAKQIAKEDYQGFLEQCPDTYFEQQSLQAFVLGYAKDDIETILWYADRFIPKIGDWSVNDSFCQTFTIARGNRARVWEWLMGYAAKEDEYSQRAAAVLLMSHFLTDEYVQPVLDVMNRLSCDGYYTRMGVAWCVATAYAKYREETYAFLLDNRLADWTYNKAIQKMLESFRVSDEDKKMLRGMKRQR